MNTSTNNHLIIRDRPGVPSQIDKSRNTISIKRYIENDYGNARENPIKYRRVNGQNGSSLPQIAIKMKDNDSPSSVKTEVVLINGNWDTTNKIPNIIAEMHNVDIEELQSTWNSNPSDTSFDVKEFGNDLIPSPKGSDSGIEGDSFDGNLSWLLNYKIQELTAVPSDCDTSVEQAENSAESSSKFSLVAENNSNGVYVSDQVVNNGYYEQHVENVNVSRLIPEKESNNHPKDDTVKLHGHAYRYSGPRKPPFTYTELIEHALNEKGELTVSGIYQWISDHFPFYKQNDDRWKNSVRHNLSINPHFRKGNKAVHGAGHLWTIAQREDKKTWNIKKQRMQQFLRTSFFNDFKERQRDIELETATASILPENTGENSYNVTRRQAHVVTNVTPVDKGQPPIGFEYVNVLEVTNGLEDFLCPPVPKEQVVEECGLSGDYIITDLNPSTLGLNLSDAEIIAGGNLYDELNFQCYELQNE